MKRAMLSVIGRRCLIVISLGVIAATSLAAPVSAQRPTAPQSKPSPNSTTGQALEIAPPVINLTANPGQVLRTQISLRDVSPGKLLVRGEVNDFVAAGEDGTPKILLEETEPGPYSLRPWIGALPELILEPRQIRNLPVVIKVPANAAPGGYYGVVRFTATPPELDGTGVSLSASLGSLILVRVNGDADEKMEIAEFFVSKNGRRGTLFQSAPVQFTQRIKNTGNIHQQPAGQVTVTDMFGKKVAATNINLPPRNVLPDSIRKFEQPLDSTVIGNKKLFGRYTATMNLTYGTDKQVLTQSLTFWVIPYTLIGIILVVLIGGFFVLRTLIRRYNKSIIKRAQQAQSAPPKAAKPGKKRK